MATAAAAEELIGELLIDELLKNFNFLHIVFFFWLSSDCTASTGARNQWQCTNKLIVGVSMGMSMEINTNSS